jgi:hypothetical protein
MGYSCSIMMGGSKIWAVVGDREKVVTFAEIESYIEFRRSEEIKCQMREWRL